jgi:hypothetical protein
MTEHQEEWQAERDAAQEEKEITRRKNELASKRRGFPGARRRPEASRPSAWLTNDDPLDLRGGLSSTCVAGYVPRDGALWRVDRKTSRVTRVNPPYHRPAMAAWVAENLASEITVKEVRFVEIKLSTTLGVSAVGAVA